MKISHSFLALFLLALITFIGCKKEDSTPKNHIMYKGVEYPMDKVVMVLYDEIQTGVYDVELVLLSPEFKLHYTGDEIDSLSGTGSGIAFELITGISTGLDKGTYNWGSYENPVPFTLSWADAVFNYNSTSGEGIEVEATDGELIVNDNGDIYEISFTTTMDGGQTVSGFYKGTVMKFNDYKKKSATKKQLF